MVGLQKAVLVVADYDAVAAAAFVDTIVGQLQVTYVQATLRYAANLDEQVDAGVASHDDMYKNQGEGWTFWRVISPLVAKRDPAAAQLIDERYNMATKPAHTNFYCLALRTLVSINLPSGVTAAHVGTLENAHDLPVPAFLRCSTYPITSTPASQLNDVGSMDTLKAMLPAAVLSGNVVWAPLQTAYVDSGLQALARADYDGEARHDAYEVSAGWLRWQPHAPPSRRCARRRPHPSLLTSPLSPAHATGSLRRRLGRRHHHRCGPRRRRLHRPARPLRDLREERARRALRQGALPSSPQGRRRHGRQLRRRRVGSLHGCAPSLRPRMRARWRTYRH
jgi:hypothetical protein